MKIFDIVISPLAKEQINSLKKAGDKILVAKIGKLLDEIEVNPFIGSGKPERLKFMDGNVWSRRINKKHRLVYEVFVDEIYVEIVTASGHYGDK